jgi:Uncharacterized protein conserved in bacteria
LRKNNRSERWWRKGEGTANGAGEIIAIKIDKEVVDPNDVEFLEEMVLSAVKQGIEQGKTLAQSEMSRITGGLGL